MDIIEKINIMTIDEMGLSDIPSEFMNDPLYKKVLTAKSASAQKKAMETLKSIRGPGALKALKFAMNPKSNRKTNEYGFKKMPDDLLQPAPKKGNKKIWTKVAKKGKKKNVKFGGDTGTDADYKRSKKAAGETR